MIQIESSNLRTQVGIIGILTHPINQKNNLPPPDVNDDSDKF